MSSTVARGPTVGILPTLLRGASLLLRQNAMIFRPGPELARSPADLGVEYEDLDLPGEEGGSIHGWWIPGSAAGKAVIYFHGSDGNVTCELPTLAFFLGLGTSVAMVEYPGYGRSGGRPSERGCYQAAEAAWHFVRATKGFRGDDVILYGQSLGSAVAVYLASSRRCGGLVVQSGFTSVVEMAALACPYLPVAPFCRTKMNSLERIASCRCPVLVLHSPSDEHIPIVQARRLYERAPAPKRFVELGGRHGSAQWLGAADVRAAWEELLGRHTWRWATADRGAVRRVEGP